MWDRRVVALEQWVADHGAALVAVLTPLLLLEQFVTFGSALGDWDWPSVTAGVTFALALPFALRVGRDAGTVLRRLEQRRVLEQDTAGVRAALDESAAAWARWSGLVGGVVLLAGFLWVWGIGWRLPLVVFGTVAGVLAGRAIGRLVATSRLGTLIERRGDGLALRPGHPDGTGGVRIVGDHYFRQAMVLAVPAVWLAVRLSLPMIPLGDWRGVYVVLLGIVVALEVAAFVLPMRSFHVLMRRAKEDLRPESDRLGAEVATLLEQLAACDDDAERRSLEERIRTRRQRYEAIAALPSWPVATEVRRSFALRNALVLVPGVLNALGIVLPGAELLQQFLDVLESA